MILILQKNTPEPAIRQLLAQLSLQNVKGGCVAGENAILLPLVGETWRLDPSALQALPFVMEARRLTPAYRLAGRAAHPENTVVTVGDVSIGADFCLIAGPCAVESAYQMDTLSRAVKDAGAQLLRGGVFKPRTSPYTFQGMGEPGVDLLVQAGRSAGLPTVTEISDVSQMELLSGVDVWQVGARNMQNFTLLKALGQARKPILLKRGAAATVEELLLAAEYILSGGNEQVILCERGIRSGLTAARAALDVSSIPVLKRLTHLPVIVDPSHAAGSAALVPPLALAAALRSGRCDITHAARLRYKECDRLDAVSCVLNALGADIVQLEDGLIIRGVPKLRGGAAVDCRNDHRIAMMAAVAAAVCSDPVIILGAECVGKSYPDFWKVFRELGGAASAV